MSSFVYPTLPGLTFEVLRTPQWHTEKQVALSGKRSSIAYQFYPLTHFELIYSLLRDDIAVSDVKALVGLFNALQGDNDSFLFNDPDFNSVVTSQFGTGDGTTANFQLTAFYQNVGGPGYAELVQNLNGAPSIFVNGVLQTLGTAYTVGSTALITFLAGHIPAAAAVITWTGSFYYRCVFDEDHLELVKFMNKWWSIKKVPFTSINL